MESVAGRASPGEVPEPLRTLKEGSAIDNIYDEMTSFSALCKAHKEIANGAKADALRFEYDLETNLHDISDDLRRGMVPKVSYRSFYVYVPKTRKVIYVDYTSKVIQRAVYDAITPRLVKGFISDTYACIPGRGQLSAMLRVSDWMGKARRSPDEWYYFKFDIHKFFYRIDHDILIAQLEKKFGDERLIDLISYYVDDMRTPFGISESLPDTNCKITKDDMVYEAGIPIGGGLSHSLGNLYMDPLDQFIKRELQCRYYARYADDGIIFDNNRDRLKDNAKRVEEFAADRLKLTFNNKTALRPASGGVEWVGCNIYGDYARLRKSTTLHMKHSMAKLMQRYHDGHVTLAEAQQSVASYQALGKYCDMDNFNDFIWNHWFVLTKGDIDEARRLSYSGYLV